MTVLHLGCIGSGAYDQSFRLKVIENAKEIVGVDINKNELDFLTERGIKTLVNLDVENLDKLCTDTKFNVILAGEILKHLVNPRIFLKRISGLMDKDAVLILSVPNAFSLRGLFSVIIKGKELVRDDHMYYSYVTLKALLN